MRASAILVAALLVQVSACGDSPAATDLSPPVAEPELPTPAGDPLLARARESIVEGRIDPEVAAAIASSEAPEHSRARRILAVMDETEEAAPAAEGSENEADVPAIVAPPAAEAHAHVPPVPPPSGDATSSKPSETTPRTVPAAETAPARDRGTLTRMALSRGGKGATLTLFASGGVLVGVANQHASNIVRLVVETDRATSDVLQSRPKIEGVRVASVRRGSGSVFVTLELEEGWSLGKIERFSGGARVRLTGP